MTGGERVSDDEASARCYRPVKWWSPPSVLVHCVSARGVSRSLATGELTVSMAAGLLHLPACVLRLLYRAIPVAWRGAIMVCGGSCGRALA